MTAKVAEAFKPSESVALMPQLPADKDGTTTVAEHSPVELRVTHEPATDPLKESSTVSEPSNPATVAVTAVPVGPEVGLSDSDAGPGVSVKTADTRKPLVSPCAVIVVGPTCPPGASKLTTHDPVESAVHLPTWRGGNVGPSAMLTVSPASNPVAERVTVVPAGPEAD